MKIGIPKALLYYRYSALWSQFFEALGCEVITSEDTNGQMLGEGVACCIGECCLPMKVYLGHVASLVGRCDRILVPRLERLGRDEEFCIRFWGLPDIVAGTFPQARLLTYDLKQPGGEEACFLRMGSQLGQPRERALGAYRRAREIQRQADEAAAEEQKRLLAGGGIKVLVSAQPYLIHDPYVGHPLLRMLREGGAVPIFPDRCDRVRCRTRSGEISRDLYWVINREVLGSIPLLRDQVDGVMLLSAFPCGTDSLANELAMRRIQGLPVTQIVLDEQQGEAGLQTRVECFLDILRERRRFDAS